MGILNRVKITVLPLIVELLFFIFFPSALVAQQDLAFHHLKVEDGLSQSTVYCVLQDKSGFLWMGTGDGLNRYDGNGFIHYKPVPGDTSGISSSVIVSLFEDSAGLLWIGTNGGGLCLMNPFTGKFITYKNNPADTSSLSSDRVFDVMHWKDSRYLVATFGGGLNVFDVKAGKFSVLTGSRSVNPLTRHSNVRKLLKASDGIIWIATREGLHYLDAETNAIGSYFTDSLNPNSLPENRVQSLFEDSQKRLWVGTLNRGICYFDRNQRQFVRITGHQKLQASGISFINCFYEDESGRLWIGTNGNGILLLDTRTLRISHLQNEPENNLSISSNQILCFHRDRGGIVWIGNNGSGLDLYAKPFDYFTKGNIFFKEDVSAKNVYSILEDSRKGLWFGTNGSGLYYLDMEKGQSANFVNSPGNKRTLSDNSVWSIAEDNAQKLWIGTNGGGLNLFDRKKGEFNVVNSDFSGNSKISGSTVLRIFKDRTNHLWIGTQIGGAFEYDSGFTMLNNYRADVTSVNSINNNTVYDIYEDGDQLVYFGTGGGGLNVLNRKTGKFQSFKSNPGIKSAISNNDVLCIHEDANGIIWLGTNGGGLNAFDKESHSFLNFTEKDGLPNNVIYAIGSDRRGHLWLSTNNGICRFTPPDRLNFKDPEAKTNLPVRVKGYSVRDGLSSSEFNLGAYFQNKEGWMYFGNTNGVTCFHPDSIRENQFNAPVVLTGFKVFEKTYPLDSGITYTKKIILKYSQNFYSFEFASLNYLLPEKNTYAFRMEGFDPDWNFIGSRHYASYTNLDPGEYVFKVKATNNDGIWSDKMAVVTIVITPPFWKTGWFKGAMTLFVAGLSLTGFRLRVRQIRKEEQKKAAFERELAEVEMKALRAQMNPHFIFNSLNSINKYIWANDQASASDYLARFSRLIRLIFENSMHQSVPLSSDLEALDLYIQMERLRFENRLEYSITVDDTVDTEQVLVPPLIFQPFVENAILHGLVPKVSHGKLTIDFHISGNNLVVVIEDNGIGRIKSSEINRTRQGKHKSLGMKVTQDRLDLLNQKGQGNASVHYTDLMDENGYAAGTRVEITMPVEY